MKSSNLLFLIFSVVLYYVIKYYFWFYYILYPIQLFVTFLHEFWHSFFALITGWNVLNLDINKDWSWLATNSWGIQSIILMWWYIGSALFWGILMFIGANYKKYSYIFSYIIVWLLFYSSIFWFADFMSSLIQVIFWISLFIIWKYFKVINSYFLELLWILSILYIIEDFNVWPTSDLSKFSNILPSFIWMYIWFGIVLILFAFFIKFTYFRKQVQDNTSIYK